MIPVERQYPKDCTILATCIIVVAASLILHLGLTGVHAAKLLNLEVPDLCPVHRISGFWCPGCGLTRAFIATAHGDIQGAFRFNPLGPILFWLLALQIPYRIVRLTSQTSPLPATSHRMADSVQWILLIALVLSGGWRIAWGLTHLALLQVGEAPPSNWAMSILLIALATMLWIALRLCISKMSLQRIADPLFQK